MEVHQKEISIQLSLEKLTNYFGMNIFHYLMEKTITSYCISGEPLRKTGLRLD